MSRDQSLAVEMGGGGDGIVNPDCLSPWFVSSKVPTVEVFTHIYLRSVPNLSLVRM